MNGEDVVSALNGPDDPSVTTFFNILTTLMTLLLLYRVLLSEVKGS